MKLQLPFLLLVAVAECNPQFGGGKGGTTLPFAGKTVGKARIRTGAKREILRYGPVELYAKSAKKPFVGLPSMDPKGQSGIAILSKGLCSSCTVLAARFLLTYEDGSRANPESGLYIHHVISYDTTKTIKNVISGCEGGLPGTSAPFIDNGEDSGDTETIFTTPDGKYNSGFHMKNSRIMMQYDLVNYKDVAKKFYINLELEYVDGVVGQDAAHTLKTVTCNPVTNPRVNNGGPSVTTSPRMNVNNNATIVWARGHLHAGGVNALLMVNGKTACTSLPTYDNKGVITHMTLCPKPISVKKGDVITISSLYDLSKHKLREATDGSGRGAKSSFSGGSDVMGMVAMSYAY